MRGMEDCWFNRARSSNVGGGGFGEVDDEVAFDNRNREQSRKLAL